MLCREIKIRNPWLSLSLFPPSFLQVRDDEEGARAGGVRNKKWTSEKKKRVVQVKHLMRRMYKREGGGGTKTSLTGRRHTHTHAHTRERAPLVRCGCSAFPHSALRSGAKRMHPPFIPPRPTWSNRVAPAIQSWHIGYATPCYLAFFFVNSSSWNLFWSVGDFVCECVSGLSTRRLLHRFVLYRVIENTRKHSDISDLNLRLKNSFFQ